jgi:hypothetical protein
MFLLYHMLLSNNFRNFKTIIRFLKFFHGNLYIFFFQVFIFKFYYVVIYNLLYMFSLYFVHIHKVFDILIFLQYNINLTRLNFS